MTLPAMTAEHSLPRTTSTYAASTQMDSVSGIRPAACEAEADAYYECLRDASIKLLGVAVGSTVAAVATPITWPTIGTFGGALTGAAVLRFNQCYTLYRAWQRCEKTVAPAPDV